MIHRVIAATVLTTVALGASPASADVSAQKEFKAKTAGVKDGAKAKCDLKTWKAKIHDDHAQITCKLTDTKSDGRSVYVRWWQDGYGYIELANTKGGHPNGS